MYLKKYFVGVVIEVSDGKILWLSNYYVNMSLGLKKVAEKLKMILSGLKSGQDLENRAAHAQQELSGVPPGDRYPSQQALEPHRKTPG